MIYLIWLAPIILGSGFLGWMAAVVKHRCQHIWVDKKRVAVVAKAGDKLPIREEMQQQCSECGDWRTVDL